MSATCTVTIPHAAAIIFAIKRHVAAPGLIVSPDSDKRPTCERNREINRCWCIGVPCVATRPFLSAILVPRTGNFFEQSIRGIRKFATLHKSCSRFLLVCRAKMGRIAVTVSFETCRRKKGNSSDSCQLTNCWIIAVRAI